MGKTHLTRRELIKQDDFLVTANEAWDYFQEHARQILVTVGTVAAVVAVTWGVYWYIRSRQVVSNEEISNAIQLYNSPLINEGRTSPLNRDQRVFATSQEKYSTAEKEFARLTRKYHGKLIGETATYYDGMCKFYLSDTAGAIKELESINQTAQDTEISALAKFSLAEIYGTQKNTAEVTKLLQQLIDHPTITVPKATAMMTLANYYQSINNKDSAIQLYKKIQAEFPSYSIQGDVSTHLSELGSS